MGKRFWSLVLSTALVGGVVSALPARAQEAAPVAIPAEVSIEDPFQDGNYLNDQGNGGTSVSGQEVIPRNGDNVTLADASTVADLGKIWFENDAEEISVFIQTQAMLGTNAPAYIYDVLASPGQGTVSSSTFWCLRFTGIVPGVAQGQQTTWQGEATAKVVDRCNVGPNLWSNSENGTLEILPGPDATGVLKLTFPRAYSPLLADGQKITTPYARVGNFAGKHPDDGGPGGVAPAYVDNTKFGLDYALTSGGTVEPDPEPTVEPPGKNDPPGKGKKKGCDKGKGKKKGACPGGKPGKPNKPGKPTAPSCPAYVPGEEGAEAETTIVTDAATAEKPIELDFTAPAGKANDLVEGGAVYDGTASLYQNIQVDSAAADAGLYVRYEFPSYHDYDLYLNYPDGSTAANSGDFNAGAGRGLGGGSPKGGWEAGANYEQVMGIRTADCAGYTARLVSYLTNGGATKLKIWLGDVVADPVAPEGGARTAMDMFFATLGL